MKTEKAYCPICSNELVSWEVKGHWILGCEKCKRKYKASEIIWSVRHPRVTKQMLAYQAALASKKPHARARGKR